MDSIAISTPPAPAVTLDLAAARRLRDGLATLLGKERTAAADFLLALADFDQRRGWEPLGHASLFAFLHVELGLSKGGAFFRLTAARLVQRFPEVIHPLRDGRLCVTAVVEVARVLTPENQAEVLPQFFGRSAREAREVSAALAPREAPPRRVVVTTVAPVNARDSCGRPASEAVLAQPTGAPHPDEGEVQRTSGGELREVQSGLAVCRSVQDTPARAVQSTEPDPTHPARAGRRDDVEPLSADLRRLHVTVSRQFLEKLEGARDGLSHALPAASIEQVLEAALDLLLEKQARARGQVKRPRAKLAAQDAPEGAHREPASRPASPADAAEAVGADAAGGGEELAATGATPLAEPPPPRRDGPREHVPVAVRRAVWERDGGRCQWPLDSGGCCGSTLRLELDHVVPWARGGAPTVNGLRLLCRRHNRLAARLAFGARCVGRYASARAAPNAATAALGG